MIKRLRPMLILAGIAVVLGIVLWVLVAFVLPKDEAGEEKGNAIALIATDISEADSVKVENTFDTYTLVKEAIGSYYIDGKKEYTVNNTAVETFLENLSALSASRKLVEEPTAEQLEGYGLSTPNGTITVVNDDDQYVITLGTTSASGNYYCQIAGDPAVYLVDTSVPNTALLSRYQFYSSQMVEYDVNADNATELTAFTIGGTGREQEVQCIEQELADDEVGTTFIMTAPFRHSFSSAMHSELTTMLTALSSCPVVGDDTSAEALAELGLDDPVYILRYTLSGEDKEIYFGKVNASGYQYCYETSGKFVYYVEESTIDMLGYSIKEYCEDLVYSRAADELAHIKITGSGKTYNIDVGEQDKNTGEFNVTINNKSVNSESFSDFYAHIITIAITDLGEKAANSECILTATFTLTDGTVETLKFYPVSELKCFCERDGSGQFWVSRLSVERILENAQKLYDGEVITLEW